MYSVCTSVSKQFSEVIHLLLSTHLYLVICEVYKECMVIVKEFYLEILMK